MSDTETKPTEENNAPAEAAEAAGTEGTDGADAAKALTREEELEQEVAKLRDQVLRTAADFDNFRKRTRRDIEDAQRKGMERALLEVLPVADNLERALSVADSSSEVQAVIEGVQMVLRSFSDSLERLGVERVPGEGQPFDPNVHEAIQQIPTSDAAPGSVVSVLVPGYTIGNRLLRAAMVAVATAAPKAETGGDGEAPASGAAGEPDGDQAG